MVLIDYSATIMRYLSVSKHRSLSLLLSKVGHGIFYVRNDLSACCAHEGEIGTDEWAQVRTDPEELKHAFSHCRALGSSQGHRIYRPPHYRAGRPPTPDSALHSSPNGRVARTVVS